MFGGAAVVPDTPPARAEFAADFSVGLRVFHQRRSGRAWLLGPEVGFTPLKRGDDITVLWHFGLTLGYGTIPLHLAFTPRFVTGAVDTSRALGLRNGLALTAFAGLVCAEIAHQHLWYDDGGGEHDLRVTLGVDAGMLVHVLMRAVSGLHGW
jgi:hypothetical protein